MYKHIYIYLSTMGCFKILWGLSEKSPVIINIMRTVYAPWCNLEAKESGLECTCVNNDAFTVLVSGGRTPYWVSPCTVWPSYSKWVIEQQICIKFCIKLEHLPWKLFRWFRRPQLWETGYWQLHHLSTPTHTSSPMQSFFAKHQMIQVTQPLCSPDLVPCDFCLFPKLKPPLKGKRFQMRFRNLWQDSCWRLGDLCEVPVPTLKGTEVSLSYVQCFLCLLQ